MTTPLPPGPEVPVDTANQLLGETPARFLTSLIETAAGQRLALTIRTSSTTLTVLLGAADAKTWAALFSGAAAAMSQSGLIVSNGRLNGGAG